MGSEFQLDYATTPNAVLAARYGVTTGTILKWARRLRLRKDPEYRREVQRGNASKRRLTNGMTLCRRCHMERPCPSICELPRSASPEVLSQALTREASALSS
jgi:hypothetical protein